MAKEQTLDREAIWKDFSEAVRMTPAALEKHLATGESRSVGFTHEGESESVGQHEGRLIIVIKRKKRRGDLTDDDYGHMRRVVGYVRRHLAQGRPKDDEEHSRWRMSLMNWGRGPLKRSPFLEPISPPPHARRLRASARSR